MKKIFTFIAFIFSSICFGQELSSFINLPAEYDLTHSPSGQLAWYANDQGRRNIFLKDKNHLIRQLSDFSEDDGQEISSLRFSNGDKYLLFVRGGSTNREGQVPNPDSDPAGREQWIWAIGLEGNNPPVPVASGSNPVIWPGQEKIIFAKGGQVFSGNIEANASPKVLFKARGNLTNLVFSPDGSKIAFVSNRMDHAFIGIYHIESNTIEWVAPSTSRDGYPTWSPDSKRLAFLRMPGLKFGSFYDLTGGTPFAIMIGEVGGNPAVKVWESPADDGGFAEFYTQNPLYWTSTGRILFYSEHEGWLQLYSILPDGSDLVCLTPGECESEMYFVHPNHEVIFYTSNCNDIDRRHIWRNVVSGGAPVQITRGEGIEMFPVVHGDRLYCLQSTWSKPLTLTSFDLSGSEIEIISPLSKDLVSPVQIRPEQLILTAEDGTPVHAQLFRDPDQEGMRPAIVYMHGGPIRQMLLGFHYSDYYIKCYAFNQYLASLGYVVISVNFRSGTGYGRAFRRAPNQGPRGASEYQDVLAAAKYLQSLSYVDQDRIGLYGGSYGGYLTAMGLAHNSDIFKAGVDIHGVHDWAERAKKFSPGGGWGLTEDDYSMAYQSSPVAHLDQWSSPVLIIHGDDDRNVLFQQSTDLSVRLREKSVHVEELVLPDEVHGFLLHRSWKKIFEASAEFFNTHLRVK